tara:strand:- start:551 stop:769 length:219 start_codon:yes stop_codon:yes gene_type:complete
MNEWISYVKDYQQKNNITYAQALKDASVSYKKMKKEKDGKKDAKKVGDVKTKTPKKDVKNTPIVVPLVSPLN